MSSPAKITELALRVVGECCARGEKVPIERPVSLRLAMAWLVHAGVAEEWQARDLWTALAEHDPDQSGGAVGYARNSLIFNLVYRWVVNAGLPHHDAVDYVHRFHQKDQGIDLEALADQIWRMCNRYEPGSREVVSSLFRARQMTAFNDGPSIVHPRELGMIVRMENGERVISQATWGFPVVLRGKSGKELAPKPVNNARFDKLGGYWHKWARNPLRRCLIPVRRFAEAEGDYGSMTTTWLSLKDAPVFAWAGLWSTSINWGDVYTGVMTDAAPELTDIHDRCPVILAPEEWEAWLTAPLSKLNHFDRSPPAARFVINRTSVPWAKGGDPTQFAGV